MLAFKCTPTSSKPGYPHEADTCHCIGGPLEFVPGECLSCGRLLAGELRHAWQLHARRARPRARDRLHRDR